MRKLWNRLFLENRPTIGLAFFRIFAAWTTGLHVIPSLCQLEENYYHTAFKSFDLSFFPLWAVELVQKSPDSVVLFFVIFFLITWLMFLVGLFTQVSGILMMASCYYFYALNSLHIGTLSWDILLVTLFLLCVTPYAGDYFSLDALRRNDPANYKRKRPFFIQRLLQLQIACTFFYTGLYKITAKGNWFLDNPIYYLMNYPPMGVTKHFLVKEFLTDKPGLCYGIGVFILSCELALPFLLFNKKTRRSAIVAGFIFHVLLILTLDVPAIFFFLFPAQLLLFIHPDEIVAWIEQSRAIHSKEGQGILIYDGDCGFCQRSVDALEVMDLFGTTKPVDFHGIEDFKIIHPALSLDKVKSRIYLLEPDGSLYSGYYAFRRLSLKLPMMYPLIPIFYFPGSGPIGSWIYRWIAEHRYLFHVGKSCRDNSCFQKNH